MTKETAILRVDPDGVGPQSHLVSIFDPADVGQALYDTGWNNQEAIELLATIARDTVNNTARERMAAVKMIEDKSEKALTLAGIIKRISLEASTQEDGISKKLTADGLQLIRAGSARTMSTLELLNAGRQSQELIDVDPAEETDDPRTRGKIPSRKHTGLDNGQPGGDDSGSTSTVSGHGRDKPGTITERGVHGQERASTTGPESPGTSNDPTPTGGTENERSTRTTVESERCVQSSSTGADSRQLERQHGQDRGTPIQEGTNPPTLERPGYPGLHSLRDEPRPIPTRVRTTPYTPGEARRSSARADLLQATCEGEPDGPALSTPRPGDGSADTRNRAPNISARFLPAALAASGFPGDDSGGD